MEKRFGERSGFLVDGCRFLGKAEGAGMPEIPTELGIIQEPPPAEVILTDLPPEPTPPPDDVPPPLPPEPVEPSEFVLEEPTPPPQPPTTKAPPKVAIQRRPGPRPEPASYTTAHANMLSAPHPSYPCEARGRSG